MVWDVSFTCDVCGKTKGEANHWWMLSHADCACDEEDQVPQRFSVLPWSAESKPQPGDAAPLRKRLRHAGARTLHDAKDRNPGTGAGRRHRRQQALGSAGLTIKTGCSARAKPGGEVSQFETRNNIDRKNLPLHPRPIATLEIEQHRLQKPRRVPWLFCAINPLERRIKR